MTGLRPQCCRNCQNSWVPGCIATLILYVTVDTMGMNGNVWKIITSVGVGILNYIGSGWLVFQKQ